jgi:predicted enzyme related to lactoylglutathione lyase
MVFDSKPAPFAVRKPLVDLEAAAGKLGWGVALWFGCDDADALHEELKAAGIAIAFPPKDGPFGRYFAFRDPFGYTITVHTV